MSLPFEHRSLGRDGSALVSTSLERAGFLAAFTERLGGVSPEPFDSLNLSLAVGDDDRNVHTNRGHVVEGLGLPGPFALPEQVHGAVVAEVGPARAGAGFHDLSGRAAGADALTTSSVAVPLAVLTADCLPIAMASPRAGVLAVVHAGWRGLAAGILGRAAARFADPADLIVAIGPAIGPDHYEVGEEVVRAVASASDSGAVVERRRGRPFLDLAATASAALADLGIPRVDVAGVCTACEPGRLFSHRRDGPPTGRQALVAARL
jgi:purine-nucleoside/S-methyl-5'-thioadenosine phosphorylase / adenosine deaminase